MGLSESLRSSTPGCQGPGQSAGLPEGFEECRSASSRKRQWPTVSYARVDLRAAVLLTVALAWGGQTGLSAELEADPASYTALVKSLRPGDRMRLEPGTYRTGLRLHNLHGRAGSPIVIEGPAEGPPAVFLGRSGHNTVSLAHASHLVIRNLLLDGGGLEVDGIKAEHRGGIVHHITLENLTIINHGADQQVVGISTQCPAAFWIIRNNTIIGAGTGLYLGGSEGSAPFVAGLIEGNRILNTRGYNLQIKHQAERPESALLPTTPSNTVIRGNLFVKLLNGSAGSLARPNLLLGHLPLQGIGSRDGYEVASNIFFANPTEALMQAEGNVTVEGNTFINPFGPGVVVQPHRHYPRDVLIQRNFVATAGEGIIVRGGEPGFSQRSEDNRVFALEPVPASVDRDRWFPELSEWYGYERDSGGGDALAGVVRDLVGTLRPICSPPEPDSVYRYVACEWLLTLEELAALR